MADFTDLPVIGSRGPTPYQRVSAALEMLLGTPWVNPLDPDYGAVGDGTEDDSAALTAALAAGDNIRIPAGKTLRVGEVSVGDNKRIFGGGAIKKNAASPHALHITGDNVTIEGIGFAGETTSGQPNWEIKLGDGIQNPRIINCDFYGSTYACLAMRRTQLDDTPYTNPVVGLMVEGCRFRGPYSRPIMLIHAETVLIQGNLFRDCMFDAIRVLTSSGSVVIDGNQFLNIGDPTWPTIETRDAVDLASSGTDIIITNNLVDTTASVGFDVKSSGDNLRRCIIANNQIYNCRHQGIVLMGITTAARNVNVVGNIIKGCNQENLDQGVAAIALKENVEYANILANHIISNFGRGIWSESGTNKHINICDNVVINNTGYGIMQSGPDSTYFNISRNRVVNDANYENHNAQIVGILLNTTSAPTTPRTFVVDDNVATGHSSADIETVSGFRADSFLSFRGNVGGSRAAWQSSRKLLHGSGPTLAGEGEFQQGDVVFTAAAASGSAVGQVCTATGSPGTWLPFGIVDMLNVVNTWVAGQRFQRVGSTNNCLLTREASDTVDRLIVRADGLHEWGSGSATRDTNLYRGAVDRLQTDDALTVGRFTTTQRDALTVIDGTVIYNTTLAKFQGRAGGAWVDLH